MRRTLAALGALPLIVSLLAGTACLALLGVAQLIWASSEASYYLHLSLAVALIAGLCLLARRASIEAIAISVAGTAIVVACMPFETMLAMLSEDMGSVSGLIDALTSVGLLWLLYAVLLAVFTFGFRHWFIRASHAPE